MGRAATEAGERFGLNWQEPLLRGRGQSWIQVERDRLCGGTDVEFCQQVMHMSSDGRLINAENGGDGLLADSP